MGGLALLIPLGLYNIYFIKDQGDNIPLPVLLGSLVLFPLAFWNFLSLLKLEIVVTLTYLKIGNIFGEKAIAWDQVKGITLTSNRFGGIHTWVILYRHRKRNVRVPTEAISNSSMVIKAILEAANYSNPQVELNGTFLIRKPPFGIFKIEDEPTLCSN